MAESTTIRLRFDAQSHETVEVTVLAPGRLRLDVTPLLSRDHLYLGDTIEAERLADGTYCCVRVVARSPMRHHTWVVPRGWFDTPDGRTYTRGVAAAGGVWEGLPGGLLHVHLPPDAAFDPQAELDRYLSSDWPA